FTTRRRDLAADPDAVLELMGRAGDLALVTDASGTELADVMLSLEAAGFERPEDAAAVMMTTGGFTGREIERLVQRGGRETLEVALAASMAGDIDARRAASELPQLINLVDERDPETNDLAPHLKQLGLTLD